MWFLEILCEYGVSDMWWFALEVFGCLVLLPNMSLFAIGFLDVC
jgi:hypothetical protein